MNFFIYCIYVTLVGLIRVYKLVEYAILLPFNPLLKREGQKMCKRMDVCVHLQDSDKASAGEKLSPTKYDNVVHLKANNNRIFTRLANLGGLALGEAFMDKSLEVFNNNFEDISEIIKRTFDKNYHDYFYNFWNRWLSWVELEAFNLQTAKRAFQVGKVSKFLNDRNDIFPILSVYVCEHFQVHYDIGNEMWELMMEPWMQYCTGKQILKTVIEL